MNLLIALVWIINGFFCKILHLVPRHREIVARILGDQYATEFALLIGAGELLLATWILTRRWPLQAALAQLILVGLMNFIEFGLAPDLLLFGRWNLLFALAFMFLVYFNGRLQQKQKHIV